MKLVALIIFSSGPLISAASNGNNVRSRSLSSVFNNLESQISPRFGGCIDRNANPGPGDPPAFHCHFDSSYCLPNEEWLNPFEVENEGLGPCTCDDDYNSNVLIHTCFGSEVTCSANADQCPAGSFSFGDRFNSDLSVPEDCGAGSVAFLNAENESCGQQCTCNYQFTIIGDILEPESTQYGVCFDFSDNSSYCAVKSESCTVDEFFFPPSPDLASDCSCNNVFVGGCIDGTSTFSHCAVDIDSCANGQTFMKPTELRDAINEVDCRLCTDPPVINPSTSPNENPSSSPTTLSLDPTASDTLSPTVTLSVTPSTIPTASPSTSSPTDPPTRSPSALTTASPTASQTDSPTASPTDSPTANPTDSPSASPTDPRTASPNDPPTASPTTLPTFPLGTDSPTVGPTVTPIDSPTVTPTTSHPTTLQPTSSQPTTSYPTAFPTKTPTARKS